MNKYVIHPGYVRIYNTQEDIYVDAGTLAAYYGLSFGEYDINNSEQQDSQEGDIIQCHLFPRPDNKYRNIKTLYGDNGTDYHLDKMVNWRKHRAETERRKYI